MTSGNPGAPPQAEYSTSLGNHYRDWGRVMKTSFPDAPLQLALRLGLSVYLISRNPEARRMLTVGARPDALPATRPRRDPDRRGLALPGSDVKRFPQSLQRTVYCDSGGPAP